MTCRQAVDRCRSLVHPIVPCLLAPVVRPAHDPSADTTTTSDNAIATTTTTNSITPSADRTTHRVTCLPTDQQHASSTPGKPSLRPPPRSSVSSTPAGERQQPHAASSSDSAGDADPGSASPPTAPPEDPFVHAAPSSSGSKELTGNKSPAKRKREQLDSDEGDDDSDDDDDDEDEENPGEEQGEEVGTAEREGAEAMDTSGGCEGKVAERKEAADSTSDRADGRHSGGDEQVEKPH